ncbi:SET domain-containing protein 4 [Strongylocentrotus purpuratus]|uniref:SET domain-containing protein n=1 Tax=Strongylocentrotus purpuratus TaxID=7668 RepID=A0A7M7PEE3_STRPU|nr:SET domain-containing protein 4 [Strongylocentrotus purpuratus]
MNIHESTYDVTFCTMIESRRQCRRRKNIKLFNKPIPVDHDEQYITLMKWMKEHGFNCKGCCLKPAVFSDTGRGLMTKKNLRPGDSIVEIPRHLLVTAKDILNTELGPIIKRQRQKPTPYQVVCAFLLTERSKGKSSFWYPYINVLPKDFTTPAFGSTKQADFDVLPTIARSRAINQLQDIRAAFESASCLFEDIERTFPQYRIFFSLDSFVWAWFVINSRSVYIEPSGCEAFDPKASDDFALAPFLDLLNHSPGAEVTAGFDPVSNCYRIKTLDSYHAYDQVFIHYGPHDNVNLLLEYGFVIPSNPHDAVSFELGAVVDAVKSQHDSPLPCRRTREVNDPWEFKAHTLKSANLDLDLSCSMSGPSWNLQTALRILCMEYNEIVTWKRVIAENNISPATKKLIPLALHKLTTDGQEQALSMLQKLDDGVCEENTDYVENVRMLWKERLDILRATQVELDPNG